MRARSPGRRPLSFQMHRHPISGAYGCTVGLAPWGGVIGYGATPESALHTAASIASNLSNSLAQHPEIAALLPPGAAAALKGIAIASEALRSGKAIEDVAVGVGRKAAAVASKLLSIF